MGVTKKEPCGSFFIYSHRSNYKAKVTRCVNTPSPFGYSLYKQRESYYIRVGYGCNATVIDSMGELQRGYNPHRAQERGTQRGYRILEAWLLCTKHSKALFHEPTTARQSKLKFLCTRLIVAFQC